MHIMSLVPTNTMNIHDIIKEAKNCPILLIRALDNLAAEHRDAFVAEFAKQVAKKDEAHIKAGSKTIARPNFTRDTERMLKKAKWKV